MPSFPYSEQALLKTSSYQKKEEFDESFRKTHLIEIKKIMSQKKHPKENNFNANGEGLHFRFNANVLGDPSY